MPTNHIRKQLDRLKMKGFFSEVLGRDTIDSHMHSRSKGAKLQVMVGSKNYQPSEVLTVGDTIEEIEVARQYGYKCVAITEGYQSKKRLQAAKPDYLINNLTDLIQIIQELNK